ncbi:cytosolic phospholipase A2-like isoform X2 [Portunus trituberculatus]|uniref:cytosolic phospholipase A2-like isoform X2 n=1 Tax=Portunus trituberculatus TaxID=210409 RepID=UPI001E1CD2D3|nr:cytosolic phospholipase A2-like isoform X2 [Portunus trituberculatus]
MALAEGVTTTTVMDHCRSKPAHLHLKSMHRPRTTSSMWGLKFDPFQVFEVQHEACDDLQITIKRGESITKGSTFQDLMDTPDPYVVLRIPGSSNSCKRTSHVDNCTNPIWDESFHFFLDPSKEYTLHVILMDANYTMDETLGEQTFTLDLLTLDTPRDVIFDFPNGSKVHTVLTLQKNKNPDLRFSLALCKEEKNFLQIRRRKVLAAMKKLLGHKAPENEKQVPIIGVLGSGGGFRAMTCLSGAVKALQETGILDCATYITGLSGSSWYISTLFAHENFPNITHSQVQKELRDSVTKDWKWKLLNSPAYVTSMVAKYKQGQPVSFTDFFGHLLGDVLLKENKNKKLTETQPILRKGIIPMPLYTCLHAKKKVSCRSFSEWVEFSPFEIGIAKYGTFMKTQDFGCKFIVGKKIKHFDEFPLHFLQGVWGSAFTILIKRLVMEGGKKDIVQIMRDAQNEENMENGNVKDTHSSAESSDSEDEEYIEGHDDKESEEEEVEEHKSSPAQPLAENGLQYSIPEEDQQTQPKRKTSEITKGRSLDQMDVDNKKMTSSKSFDSLSSEKEGKVNGRDKGDIRPKMKKTSAFSFDLQNKKASKDIRKFSTESDPGVSTEYQKAQHPRLQRQGAMKGSRMNKEEASRPTSPSQDKWATRRKTLRRSRVEKKAGLWDGLKQSIMTGTNILNSRAGRAGEVLNPFRGLSLRHSFPISPFATDVMGNDEDQEDAVDSDTGFGASCRYKPLDNKAKKLFIVDSGLAFNSPYPLLLRPQRAVDIYLSFDFSQRPTDSSQPFKELLLAEKWATQNKVPFPPIQNQVAQYEGQEVRECYVFKHPTDPFCPVILHFPLVNNKFREFSAPGVPRETEEEKKFGDFPIFDDPSNAFSSMNFAYEAIQFDRLTKLIEFNTLLCVDTIKKELEEVVEKKKQYIPKLTFKDVVNTMKRMSSFSPGDRGNNDLTLKVSLENEEELKRRTRYASVPNEDSSDDSEDDYIDALDKIPDETTTL